MELKLSMYTPQGQIGRLEVKLHSFLTPALYGGAFCTMDTGSFPGVKRPGRDADHTRHSSAEVTKG
jgi:hypothetical protein